MDDIAAISKPRTVESMLKNHESVALRAKLEEKAIALLVELFGSHAEANRKRSSMIGWSPRGLGATLFSPFANDLDGTLQVH